MNILIPDVWLREYLDTNAKPDDIRKCLSLSGPSVERIHEIEGDIVYDIEITTNRVDAYSVYGVAREASVILPQFGYTATLLQYPKPPKLPKLPKLSIEIINNPSLCRRILAIKIENVTLAPSPEYIQKRLTLVGQRPLNNLVDITNYVMWEIGHPCHVFDIDRFPTDKLIVREAKKGEKVVTLDDKTHTMIGGEIVFDDGEGTIIDVPGIMGTANTVVTKDTKNILLFIENSDPNKIRFASMTHAIRSQAAVINEKDPDPELALTTMNRAISLTLECAGGRVTSSLYDDFPGKSKAVSLNVPYQKLNTYLNTTIDNKKIESILTPLGFTVTFTSSQTKHSTSKQSNNPTVQQSNNIFTVTPPSWRTRDITIPEDVIEEIARIYGYHNIETKLPDREPPVNFIDPLLKWEEEIKMRLRDFGYTELYTYSMISEKLMEIFSLDTTKACKINNPLSDEWVYMRPALWPSVLSAMKDNSVHNTRLDLFELSNIYTYRPNDLPIETPILLITSKGESNSTDTLFLTAKGIAESIFSIFGIPFPQIQTSTIPLNWYHPIKRLSLEPYGSLGEVHPSILEKMGIQGPVMIVDLYIEKLVKNSKSLKSYIPIPKYPPSFEDLALIVPERTPIGMIIGTIKTIDPLITNVELLDSHEQTRTVHITFQHKEKNLTAEDIRPIREKILSTLKTQFQISLKSI